MRIYSIVIRKILKRDAFLKLQKENFEKWDNLYKLSLNVFNHWSQFLTIHINYRMKWQCAQNALEEKNNDYPSLSDSERKRKDSLIKTPDYVDLMLNYNKFVRIKIKCLFFFYFYISYNF